jgi:transposase
MVKKLSEAQRKRVKAARLLQAGKPAAQVALALGVARQTVYTWKRVLDEGGVDGLRAMVDVGRPGQLSASDFNWLAGALRQGAQAHGFGTELWTLKRVGALIKRQFGIGFSDVHVWRLLGGMGFSSQKPERRAIERNEDVVRTWKTKELPSLKKKRSESEESLSSSTNRD